MEFEILQRLAAYGFGGLVIWALFSVAILAGVSLGRSLISAIYHRRAGGGSADDRDHRLLESITNRGESCWPGRLDAE